MPKVQLGDLLKIGNGRNYSTLAKSGKYPVYGSGGLMGYTDSFLFSGESVLLPRKGTLDNIQYATGKFWTVDTIYFSKIDKSKVDPYFLFHYMKLLNLKNLNTGTGVPSMTQKSYEDIPLTIPALDAQKDIARVFRSLDQKIELNNKINAELEALARDLYSYWFIQFEFPDESGRPYKTAGGAMVYNEELKREIPADWSVKTLGEVCEMYQPGILSAKDLPVDGKYLVYGSNGVIGKYNEYNHKESEVAVSCRGDCGNVYRSLPDSWITGNAMVVRPLENYSYIGKQFLMNTLSKAGLKNIVTGSVQGQITRTNLAKVKITLPPEDSVIKYGLTADKIYRQSISNELQNQNLNQLRDYLLPMLMNGQVVVKD